MVHRARQDYVKVRKKLDDHPGRPDFITDSAYILHLQRIVKALEESENGTIGVRKSMAIYPLEDEPDFPIHTIFRIFSHG
jgi:hypothetical protein